MHLHSKKEISIHDKNSEIQLRMFLVAKRSDISFKKSFVQFYTDTGNAYPWKIDDNVSLQESWDHVEPVAWNKQINLPVSCTQKILPSHIRC